MWGRDVWTWRDSFYFHGAAMRSHLVGSSLVAGRRWQNGGSFSICIKIQSYICAYCSNDILRLYMCVCMCLRVHIHMIYILYIIFTSARMCDKACAYSIYTTHFMCILQRLIKIKQLKHCYYEAYVPREAETATPSISMAKTSE